MAVVENGVLQEILIERAGKRGLVGNIYQGRVCRVLPGMEAAFVDIGLERAAFLHVSDIRSKLRPRLMPPVAIDPRRSLPNWYAKARNGWCRSSRTPLAPKARG